MRKITVLVLLYLGLHLNSAFGTILYFWDVNGTDPGCGGATPTGTWSTDAYDWSKDDPAGTGVLGTNPSAPWADNNHAVFSAGNNEASGTFTVSVTNQVLVGDIHVDSGNITIAGPGELKLELRATDPDLLSVGHKSLDNSMRFNVPLTGSSTNGIVRYKRGRMIFGATNTYAGPTRIEGGIIELGAPYVIPVTSSLILANDNGRGDVAAMLNATPYATPATFATGGFSQKLGTLNLTGPDAAIIRTIDFGGGNCALVFDDSSAEGWISSDFNLAIPLHIVNYTPGADTLRVGTDANGLTPAQLAQIQYDDLANLPARIDALGFVTPALPVILSITNSGSANVDLLWSSVVGRTYRVQSKTNLNVVAWDDLTPDVYAGDVTASFTDTSAGTTQRYYRVMVLAP